MSPTSAHPYTTGTRVTVRAAIAPLLADSRASASQTSQLLRGHRAEVVERTGAWRRLLGWDGYEGWCHEGYLHVDVSTDPPLPLDLWQDERRISLGCVVQSTDATDAGRAVTLPLGAFLHDDEKVVQGLAMNGRGRSRYFAPIAGLLVQRSIELYSGTPYVWGGVSPWGADCSGFIQTMFALHGTPLPRDSWQQGEVGAPINDEPSELRPADLLFFSDRDDAKITHVALSLGGSQMAHCSLANGGFAINSIDATDPVAQQLRKTFRFAKRVL